MIISKIWNGLNEQQQEDVVFGLAGGLAVGLVFGFAGWLVFGLAGGLAGGLAVGLVFGLVFGLAGGVLSPLWLFIPAILVISEILFFFDHKKLPVGKNKYVFTLERKAEAIFETLLVVVNVMNIYVLTKNIDFYKILMQNCHTIVAALFLLGVLAVGVIGIAVWVWLNSLKYRGIPKQEANQPVKTSPFAKSEEWKKSHRKAISGTEAFDYGSRRT